MLHTRLGNAWWAWLIWVFVLEDSAYLIRIQSTRRTSRSGRDVMPMTMCVHAMLMGYAVECAMKCLWVRKRNKIVEGGKYKGVPGVRDHDLVGLARAVGFAASPRELNVLRRLSKFAMFAGRYPVAKTPDAMKPHEDMYLNRVDVGYFSRLDVRITQSVINKLISLSSGKSRRGIGPPGSATWRRAALEANLRS